MKRRPRLFRPASSIGLALAGFIGAHGAQPSSPLPLEIFTPPPELSPDLGTFRSPLRFDDGREVRSPEEWLRRRQEIESYWHRELGRWPALLEKPGFSIIRTEENDAFVQHRVRVEIAKGRFEEGWYLVPRGPGRGPYPAVLVPFYEPDTSIGLKGSLRDFGAQLSRRGFVSLSIGSPGGDARQPDPGRHDDEMWQPLSYLAYVAANAHTALAQRPEVDRQRIGIVGHSYGGKWALFAGAFHDKFACVVVSDPGIVWDEARPNVNYWEPWYLGRDPKLTRRPGLISPTNPRTGAYRRLIEAGRDLTDVHALLAPRPFLVSGGAEDPRERWRALNHLRAVHRLLGVTNRVAMTNRATHDPTPESNARIYEFFEQFLGHPALPNPRTP